MNKMTDPSYVGALKSNMHAVFSTPQGKEIMRWMEISCGWYHSVYSPQDPSLTLINDGKRQVIATIKTIMDLNVEQIIELSRGKEEM